MRFGHWVSTLVFYSTYCYKLQDDASVATLSLGPASWMSANNFRRDESCRKGKQLRWLACGRKKCQGCGKYETAAIGDEEVGGWFGEPNANTVAAE